MTNKTHLSYGIITSLVIILVSVAFYLLKLNQERWTGYVSTVILMVGVVLSCVAYAKTNDNATPGGIFGNGFRTTAVITVLSIIFTVLFIYIFPDIKEQAIEAARKKMEEQNQSEEAIQTAIDLTRKMFIPFVIGFSLFFDVIFGLIASLVGMAIGRKYLKPQKTTTL
ncbi:uncharacterized protein DUF4199 [Chitinophaga niastensis]|uniref:Uncharacterized protein DUF4199 n=1 Tax=Chitinophaga niastensis TaxID=536980 RepID=A0A2P8HIL6_CHINA|nr:DUF4199 domain-containing protein [Chitinophaga niastensis]PSL46063.1 uncharacterized protein DUF4199 [Chitinophaga niastensis]